MVAAAGATKKNSGIQLKLSEGRPVSTVLIGLTSLSNYALGENGTSHKIKNCVFHYFTSLIFKRQELKINLIIKKCVYCKSIHRMG